MPLSPLQQELARRLAGRPPSEVQDAEIQEAAVAVLVGSDPDALLIIRRAERAGDPWSGHMGLPGGRRSRGDPDLITTAIRETREEVGLRLNSDAFLGQLDDVAPRTRTRPPVFARPFVFAVNGHPDPVPNPEVAAAWWIPLTALQEPANYRTITLDIGGVSRGFPAYHPPQGTIWGMTERVITGLFEVLRSSAG